jgi:Carotenoid biosynthesis protein
METSMPPFPGIPYGPAPHWSFPAVELSIFLMFALCFVHAWRSSRHRAVPYLLGGFAFGLILEYLEVLSHSYTYGRFWLMLGHAPLDIPICIGAGWGIILYTSRLFSDALRLPMLGAAALDTLLALNIDLSMDVVAYRTHMWHWYWNFPSQNPLTAQWFGIPYGNFVGWITVVFCYSLFSRLFERLLARRPDAGIIRFTAIALLALIASQAVLLFTESFAFGWMSRTLHITSGKRLILFVVILLVLAIAGWRKRARPAFPIPAIATWVPCWFHAFFLTCFFGLGFYRENHWMTAIACANVAAGILIHLAPWRLRTSSPENAALVQSLQVEQAWFCSSETQGS